MGNQLIYGKEERGEKFNQRSILFMILCCRSPKVRSTRWWTLVRTRSTYRAKGEHYGAK